MEAKDTVMSPADMKRIASKLTDGFRHYLLPDEAAEAQAEISFKAGQKEEREKSYGDIADIVAKVMVNYLKPIMEKAKKVGIREVVEWVNERQKLGYLSPHCGFGLLWQAKLKEWGIE